MQHSQPSLFTRHDTICGVCEGLGEDFGIDPRYLRAGFAVLLFWSPVAALGIYLVTGLIVLLSRWLYPNPCPSGASHQLDLGEAASMQTSVERTPLAGDIDEQPVELAAAA